MLGVENSEVQPSQVSPLLLNKDLFDAEDSDSDVDYTARSPSPPLEEVVSQPPDGHGSPLREDGPHQQDDDEKSSVHSDDEEENESATQRQKSPGSKSKGAKSSIAQSRTRRVPKVDAKKIHSESQRIIRESDLSLPYHKPKPLSLNDFFSKKPSKTGVVSVKKLKGLSKRQQIAVFTQQQTDTASNEINGRAALSQPSPKPNKHSRQRSPLSQSSSPTFIEPEADNGKLSSDGNSAVEESRQDISLEEENETPLRLEESSDESGETAAPEVTDMNKDADAETDNTVEKDKVNVSAQEAESLNVTSSKMITSDDGMKEDAGLAQDEEENKEVTQPAVVEVEKDNQKDDTVALVTTAEQDEDADFSLRLSPSQTPTQAPPASQSHRQKLLEASLPKLKTLTPRLSGEAELVIDLGDADSDTEAGFATPCNPGLNRLMERFVKHTARSTPRPRKEVKLSVVSKETGTDGKEDLKLETVAVTIEGEVCEDPSLKVPGAKLVKLKEALQLKMKARREIERQRRKEAYRLDNEDYNEGEEGEMTDKSDTDDESDNDAGGTDLGDGRKEKKIKKNPFVNHEAVDDDDEDYDPEEDSDEYENEDDTDNSDDESDAASNHGNRGQEQKDAPDLQIYSAETDEEDDDEDDEDENIKRVSSVGKAKKKKKLVLDDDDDEEEEEEARGDVARQQETENSPTLELHLDADDEEDEHEEKMNQDDSLSEIPTKNTQLTLDPEMNSPSLTFPRPDSTLLVGRLVTESASSQDGTMDSCDVDKLGESIMRAARSPKKTLTHEEKTRDLFESASNTDGGTTGSSEVDRAGESFTGRTNFSWSAIKKTPGAVQDDSSRELPKQMDNSSNSLDTSFELMGSIIPAHQPGGGLRRNRKTSLEEARDGFKPFSKHHSLLQNAPKSSSKLSELTLPVEDSQDLFRVDTPSLTVAMETQQGGDTQSFRFSYDDDETQTQFLDENGFLKLRSTSKPKPATKRLFEDENASQDQMDELLGLCSGKFNNGAESSSKIRKGLFSQLSSQRVEGTQGNLDELLGLCSGTFVSQKEDSQAKSTLPIHHDADTHSESSFHILSDDEGNHSDRGHRPVLSDDEESKPKKRKRIRVMDDEDSDDDDNDDVGEEDDLAEEEEEVFDSEDELSFVLKQEKQSSKKMVSGKSQEKIRSKVSKDFFDEEAELSGSEYESDEDYDAEDMPDELEQDEADKENVGTEEQLREQVNKVHMKTMEDDDARRLRLYKEMYLPDGDLYSEGKGRARQFRWRHIGDDSQMNLFPGNSDDEGEDEKDEDTQWRMERFKREQWLNEQKEKQPAKEAAVDDDDDVVEENSQFDVFMKTAVNRKRKDPVPAIVDGDKPIPKDKERPINSPKPIKFRHGSFLKRSKGDLAKIASMMKPATNTNAPRVSRNVLYQSITPQADEEDDKKPQLRRSASDSPATQAPKAKRLRLDRSQSLAKPNSIFSLM
ncbi:claspin-like isoform X2 [Patiria miniata]|uniref:Claspin n=1 Tax=Patiria miniata TaxID=46514 RepID=A0A914BD99_PATMI|nr:claspin-like isoform X2 [Patiria miniata]